ncbi:MAG: ATP-grasp domain-containing protein [Myxococcales bacterium]|nr:ATP-grasp domain-containing protein [Myxococcales bacterium]
MSLDLHGLTLVLSDRADPERDAVAAAWSAAGGAVERVAQFWRVEPIARARVYGAEAFAHVVAQRLGLTLVSPPDDLLVRLPRRLLGRAVRLCPIAAAPTLSYPCFVKSVVPKLFRSRVYRSADDLAAAAHGLDGAEAVLVSDVVTFTAEARAWVCDGAVTTIACYEGAGDLAAATALALEVAGDPAVPATCVIDVGDTTDRGWVVVEANAAWGAGLNGCDPVAAAGCIARAAFAP